jgi:arginine N-succinyltransferase
LTQKKVKFREQITLPAKADMFVIREVSESDLESLLRLASLLNLINLPRDKHELMKMIQRSKHSFRGKEHDPSKAQYLFVLEDIKRKEIVGSSLIIGKHGTPVEPHVYFSIVPKKKESRSLHMGFIHQILRLGFNYDGPTEIGALILLPQYRGHKLKLGKLMSFVRFMYMSARPHQFMDEVLCELQPRLSQDGKYPIWEEIGRKFTNLNYDEADRLSRKNKEFIHSLYPEGDIYSCMLSGEAREAIGQVNPETEAVKSLVEKIGFRYRNMIDPFDGGPHYWARRTQIKPIRETFLVKIAPKPGPAEERTGLMLCISEKGVRCLPGEFKFRTKKEVLLSDDEKDLLAANVRPELYFLPVEMELK